MSEAKRKPVMALRDDSAGNLDDVVAKGVSMFRAEMMDDRTLWMACYFDDAADERVTFSVRSARGKLKFAVGETPSVWEDFDERGASVSRSPSSPPCEFCKRSTEDNCETADDLAHCAYAPSSTDAPGIGNRLSPSSPAPSAEELRVDRDLWRAEARDLRARVSELEAERERLRKRTHELAERADKEVGPLRSQLARLQRRYDEAREHVKDWPVNWTTDPPSQEPGGWWRYTSIHNADHVTALLARATDAERRVSELEKALVEIRDRTRQDQPALGAAERAHHVARRARLSDTEGGGGR